MKKYVIICILFFCTAIMASDTIDNSKNQKIQVEKIYEHFKVLDEWKNPGKYSPINVFDGNLKTCFAEGNRDESLLLSLVLKSKIYIDEIRIVNGYAKNDNTFLQNNRIKEVGLFFYNGNIKVHEEKIQLKDIKTFQSIKLPFTCFINEISFNSYIVYKGTKYNDTCISEIEFYYKGKKIPLANIKNSRKEYLKQISRRLSSYFLNKTYSVGDKEGTLKAYKNGNIEFKDDFGKKSSKHPTAWKVSNAKLYFKMQGKWKLVEYFYSADRNVIGIEKIGGVEYNRGYFPLWY